MLNQIGIHGPAAKLTLPHPKISATREGYSQSTCLIRTEKSKYSPQQSVHWFPVYCYVVATTNVEPSVLLKVSKSKSPCVASRPENLHCRLFLLRIFFPPSIPFGFLSPSPPFSFLRSFVRSATGRDVTPKATNGKTQERK